MKATTKGQTARERDTAIFVGGIIGCVTEPEIRDYFEQFGPIYSITLIPKKSNPSLNSGYCFISFKEPQTKKAVLAIESHYIYGRRVNCKSLLKGTDLKEEKTKNNCKKLCIKFLPVDTTEHQFEAFFSRFGKIHSFYLVNYKSSLKPTCNGYVVFKEEAVFRKVLGMKSIKYGQERVKVELYTKKQQQDSQLGSKEVQLGKYSVDKNYSPSIRPTQAVYHKQSSGNDDEENLRFNINLSEKPMTSRNMNRIASLAASSEGTSATAALYKLE